MKHNKAFIFELELMILFAIGITNFCNAQEKLEVKFEKSIDSIYGSSEKEVNYMFKIIVSNPNNFKNYTIIYEPIEIESTIGFEKSHIYNNEDKEIKIEGSKDTTYSRKIKIERTNKSEKLLVLVLKCYDASGKPVALTGIQQKLSIYVKPLINNLSNIDPDYFFYIMVGTNLDLLDGIKPKEINLKGSYLFNFNLKDRPSMSSLYITFGKNRFFSERDSLSRLYYKDFVIKPNSPDSITLTQGYYNVFRQTVTENIYISGDYLFNFRKFSSQTSKVYANFGAYLGIQNVNYKFSNKRILSADTFTQAHSSNSEIQLKPINENFKQVKFNYFFNLGLTHILNTSKIHVITQAKCGLNLDYYPKSYMVDLNKPREFKKSERFYTQLLIDCLIKNLGISFGFESITRYDSNSLFNISITKVFNIEKISTALNTPNLN